MLPRPMTQENDIVLIHFENTPIAFARIEEIFPDKVRDWFNVKLLLLQLPLKTVIWTLREAYINGDTFTMGGKEVRLERIECPEDPKIEEKEENGESGEEGTGIAETKIISLADRKKN